MIRLPLTSISLSKADVDYHLHEIDIYRGLLQQGFKKKEVLQYFRSQEREKGSYGYEGRSELEELVDTVSLASRRLKLSDPSFDPTEKQTRKSKTTSNLTPVSFEAHERDRSQATDKERTLGTSSEGLRIDTASPSRRIFSDIDWDKNLPTEISDRHTSQPYAPRHSSLLRFTNNLSSDDESVAGSDPFSLKCSRSAIADRPRTNTRSSEGSDTDGASDDVLDRIQRLTIDGSQYHNEFHGGTGASTQLGIESNTPEVSTLNSRSSSPKTDPCARYSDLEISQSPCEASGYFPSSPPSWNPAIEDLDQYSTSLPPQRDARDPFIVKEPQSESDEDTSGGVSSQNNLTAAITTRSRGTTDYCDRDERFFTVYDDTLPSSTQPQTPADLRSRNVIDDHNVSYTAPPGMMRYGSQIQEHTGIVNFHESDYPSPTIRAIDLRNRRNREYRRSATVEGLRLNRTRRMLHDNNADVAHRAHLEQIDIWRDELDADRVGEENFDLDPNVFQILGNRTTRTLSGD